MIRLATFIIAALVMASCTAARLDDPVPPRANLSAALAFFPKCEAADGLLVAISKEMNLKALGVFDDARAAFAAASAAGVERVVVLRVVEYDPRDPARLKVESEVVDPDKAVISADALIEIGRNYGAVAQSPRGERRFLEISASGKSPRLFAERLGLGAEPVGLLEAEILLRDPAGFFEFAAAEIAAFAASAVEHDLQD